MVPNEIVTGVRRVGDFVDFDPETPTVKVTLERSERGIGVAISWSESDSPYAAWFVGSHSLRIPPIATSKPVPKRACFQDSHGSVLLIRCWAQGFHSIIGGPGSGTLWSRAAILDVSEDIEFESPHGLRTEISGLREWLGVTSWTEQVEHDGGSVVATLTSQSPPPIVVGSFRGITVSLRPGWQIVRDRASDRRVVLDLVRCESTSGEPLGWDAHLAVHFAIRDLLVLSRWHPESCVEVFVSRADDPLRTEDGKDHGAQWREVVVADDKRALQPSGVRLHLYSWDLLKEAGVLHWLSLRDEFARALDPVISSIELQGTSPTTLLAHSGPGLEALGYLLMVRDGIAASSAARASLLTRFHRILQDLGDCLPFDGSTWAKTTVATYNGLKHANRAAPDEIDVLNAWRESVVVVRAWVALELGIPPELVKQRLSRDPQRHPFVKLGSA